MARLKEERCGNCENMTNIADEERKNDNIMGGCFIDGHIVTTDCKSCKKFKKWKYIEFWAT